MATTYKDQFYFLDPGGPPPRGTPVSVTRATVTDQNDDGLIVNNSGDTFNGEQILDVWAGDELTIRLDDGTRVTYTGVTFYLSSGAAVFTPTDGQVLQDGTFFRARPVAFSTQTPVSGFGPTCFTPGMMIATQDGDRPVEDIRVGDRVLTLDQGPQPVRHIPQGIYDASGDLAPIRFAKGAIGNRADLLVSPQHRVLVRGWQAELLYGRPEVLAVARHLVNGSTIRQVRGGRVRYIHLLFDRHQLIWAQGVLSESCFSLDSGVFRRPGTRAALDEAGGKRRMVRPVIGWREAALLRAA